ncbi:hypothetical protein JCM14720_21830 [Calditerricola yamamurae]
MPGGEDGTTTLQRNQTLHDLTRIRFNGYVDKGDEVLASRCSRARRRRDEAARCRRSAAFNARRDLPANPLSQ